MQEPTAQEVERRKKFSAFFDKVSADHTEGPIADRNSMERCKFENMPSHPAADPMAEVEKKDNFVWHDYSEVKLTPHPEATNRAHQRRLDTFNALYNNTDSVH